MLGIVAAIGASTLYSLGIAFQAMDAKEAPEEEHLRLALARGLIRRRRWLLGTGLSILGFPLQLLALHLAPLVVVQPTLAVGLLVLLVAAELMLGERPGRYEYVTVAAIALGVTGAGLFAPRTTTVVSSPATTALVLAAIGAAALTPYLLRLVRHPFAGLTIFCAGCAFAWSAIATKLAANDLFTGYIGTGLLWAAATAPASGLGTLSEMSSLQSRPAIQVAPVVFVTQTVLPIAMGPLLFGEHFDETPLDGWPLMVSLALLVAGAAALARSPLLVAMMEGHGGDRGEKGRPARGENPAAEQAQADSAEIGATPSPSAASRETMRSKPSTDAADPSSSTTNTSPARIGR